MSEFTGPPASSGDDYKAERPADYDPENLPGSKPWVPEEAIQALAMEADFHPSESSEKMAERIFQENLPLAANAITHMAAFSPSERIRFDAAKYVVERNLGKIEGAQGKLSKEATPWDALLAASMREEEDEEVTSNA